MEIQFVKEKKFEDCKNSKVGRYCRRLPFDFYLPDYNLLIEYDGEQHFKPVDIWGGEEGFARQQILDGIKNKFAADHKIKLIRMIICIKTIHPLLCPILFVSQGIRTRSIIGAHK